MRENDYKTTYSGFTKFVLWGTIAVIILLVILVVNKYQMKIHYEKFNNSGIIAKSRNLGLKISKGEWVCFLDADDKWMEEKLELTYKKIIKNKFDVICNSEWIKYINEPIKGLWCYGPFKKKNFYKEMLLFGNKMSTSATTIKKSFLINNKLTFSEKKEFISCEDYDLFLNIAKQGGTFHFINKPMGVRLIHASSTSSKKEFHQKSYLNVLNSHILKMKFDKKKIERILLYEKTKYQFILLFNEKYKMSFFLNLFVNFIKNPISVIQIFGRLSLIFIKQKILLLKYKKYF